MQRLTPWLLALGLCVPVANAAAAPAEAEIDLKARLLLSIQLPTLAYQARVQGVAEEDIQSTIKAAEKKEIGASRVAEVMLAAVPAANEHGPVKNFGKFVQAKLDEGLRGKELALAIREEHKARGIGKGKKLGHFKAKLDPSGRRLARGHGKMRDRGDPDRPVAPGGPHGGPPGQLKDKDKADGKDHEDHGKHLGHLKDKGKDGPKDPGSAGAGGAAKDKDEKGKGAGGPGAGGGKDKDKKGKPKSSPGSESGGKAKGEGKGKGKGKDK